MATMLDVTCRLCVDMSHQADGPFMTALIFRCSTCGQRRSASFDEIDVDPNALTFSEIQAAMLESIGQCECSGQFSTDAPIRCPSCQSKDGVIEVVGHAD